MRKTAAILCLVAVLGAAYVFLYGRIEPVNRVHLQARRHRFKGSKADHLDIDLCAASPCQHGFCVVRFNRPLCICEEGWTGLDCSAEKPGCHTHPCHHGRCREGVAGYTCFCDEGWTGPNCDEDKRSEVEREQSKRMAVLNEYCGRHPERKSDIPSKKTLGQLIVNDKYNILYCFVPKTGCTTTKLVFYNLELGTNHTENTVEVHQYNFTFLDQYSDEEIIHRLQTYHKFIVVRDPLERLLSAWRDKFVHGRDLLTEKFQDMWNTISNNSVSDDQQDEDLRPVPFLAFIKAVAADKKKWFNAHWQPAYKLCSPCQVKYDFVAHTDTLAEDFPLFFHKVGIKGKDSFLPEKRQTRGEKFLAEDYKVVPLEDMRVIGSLFRPDFEMFGYSFEEDINGLLKQT